MRKLIPIILILSAMIIPSIVLIATYGAPATPQIDNTGRREYVYCPANLLTLDSRATYSVEGCPLTRIYVNNWNGLSTVVQTAIDTQLRSLGFRDANEVGLLGR
jgi:hypothetical protein